MEQRPIGSLSVSVVGLGCNNFGMRIDAAASERVVGAALDAGINFFDTADTYGATKSEEFLGRALARRRKDAIVATKFGMAVDEQRKGAKPEFTFPDTGGLPQHATEVACPTRYLEGLSPLP